MRGLVACAAMVAASCEARLGPSVGDEFETVDAFVYRDAGVDAPVDARPCTGGAKAAVGPDGSCFVHVTTPLTYANAKAACAAMNAHLAFLKDAVVDEFARSLVGTTNTWIGLTDGATEGTFVWDDGTALAFSSWYPGEPNNGGVAALYQEDCTIIAGSRQLKRWDDRPCDPSMNPTSGSFAYLCQY